MTILELKSKEEMLAHLVVLNELYPNLTEEDYAKELDFMIQHNYYQIAVMIGDKCIGISGYWIGNKLWCGPYLEIDNIVVCAASRSRGAGDLIISYLRDKAVDLGCSMMALDSYTNNFKAHKFFYNQGFSPKGFHFINVLDKTKIR